MANKLNKKEEFYLSIKAILDKQDLLDDARELRDLMSDVKMDLNSEEFEKAVRRVVKKLSKQTMAHITRGLNDGIKALGGKPIALEELIQKPNLQMWEAWGNSIGDLIGKGISEAIGKSLNNIGDPGEKFDSLIRKRQQLEEDLAIKKKREKSINDLNPALRGAINTRKTVKIDDQFPQHVKYAVTEFKNAQTALEGMYDAGEMNTGVVYRWIEATQRLIEVQNTVKKQNVDVRKSWKIDDEINYIMAQTQGSFMNHVGVGYDYVEKFIDKSDVDELSNNIDIIEIELKELDRQIQELTNKYPELIDKSDALESEQLLKRVKEAYDSLLKTKGKRDNGRLINNALEYEGVGSHATDASKATSTLQKLHAGVQKNTKNEVDRAIKLIKFQREYESQLGKFDIDTTIKDTYDDLKPEFAKAEALLRGVLDMINRAASTTGGDRSVGDDSSFGNNGSQDDSSKGNISFDEKQLRAVLEAITYNVKIIADNDDAEPNKVVIDEQSLKMALQSIVSGSKSPATGDEGDGSTQAPWALEETLKGKTNTKLDAIKTALEGIGAQEKTVPVPTNGTGFATENTLGSIKAAVEAINQKVVKGTKASTSDGSASKKSSGSSAGSQLLPERLKTQGEYLKKFGAQLKATGRLTDDVKKDIRELFAELRQVQNVPDLSNWIQQFSQLKARVGVTDIKAAGSYEELIELQKLRNKLELEYAKAKDGSALKQVYAEQLTKIDDLIDSQQIIQKNDKYEIELRKMQAEQTRKLAKIEADRADKSHKQKQKLAKKQAMVGKAGSAVNRAENVWLDALSLGDKVPKDFQNQIDKLQTKFEKLGELQHKINNSDIVDKNDVKALQTQTVEVNKLTMKMNELLAQYKKFNVPNAQDVGVSTLAPNATLEQQRNYLTNLAKSYFDGKVSIKGFNDATGELIATVQGKGSRAITTYTMGITQLDGKVKAVATSTHMAEGFFDALKRKLNEIKSYVSAMSVFSFALQQIKQGIQYVKEIDLALTELRKVTDETEETYDKFLETAAKTGEKLGSTISAVTEATATFAKLGYSIEQASEMAEAALVYKNVGDNIESAEDAADSIISTLKGFGLEASEAMAIVDRFNEVGNRFAITSKGIGEALRLSASALNEGGNSLDESIGLITAANEVVNDPSSVGTALKTLTLRLRGSKTELEEMGEDVSDMATTTSQLQAKLLALTGGKVDIMLDADTFKNSTQILREMAAAWEDMTDIQRAEWCPYVQKCA